MTRTPLKHCIRIFFILSITTQLWSHGDEKHPIKASVHKTLISQESVDLNASYQIINTAYLSKIKPIFSKKCFDCHGTLTHKPWYYNLPIISYIIQKDIKEAKEHIDMHNDFPFISHESPYNDLESLKKIGLNGGMPPLQYIIGHWNSKLTEDERKKIVNWSNQSMKMIQNSGITLKNDTQDD